MSSPSEINTGVIYAPEDFKPHWYEDLAEETYHGDKTGVGSSDLRMMLDSPKAFYWGFFKGYQKEQTNDMRLGKLIHLAVLEGAKFKNRYVVMPEFTGYTAKGELTSSPNCTEVKKKKAAWMSDQPPGAVITTEAERDTIIGIIDSIMEHPNGPDMFKNGRPEVSGYFRDPETGIRCKVRLDFLTFNGQLMTDLKSAVTSKRAKFGSNAFSYRYDIQLAVYREACKAINGFYPDVSALVAVEKTFPFECAMYYFQPEDFVQAEVDYHRALRRLDKCIKGNHWPQRQQIIERIHTPAWFVYESVNDNEGAENE